MINIVGIYAIINLINNKYYIGQSKNINRRWIVHKSELKNNRHVNKHLQNAWNKYGEENFEFKILVECSISELDSEEIKYINLMNSYINGYNLCEGGNGNVGYKHTPEEIEKMRLIQNPRVLLQFDNNKNIINRWIGGASHASKITGYGKENIKKCCNMEHGHKTAYGYFWFYEDDYSNNLIDWNYYLKEGQEYNNIGKELIVLDKINNNTYNFKSISEAANKLNLNRGTIYNLLAGISKLNNKYEIKYA